VRNNGRSSASHLRLSSCHSNHGAIVPPILVALDFTSLPDVDPKRRSRGFSFARRARCSKVHFLPRVSFLVSSNNGGFGCIRFAAKADRRADFNTWHPRGLLPVRNVRFPAHVEYRLRASPGISILSKNEALASAGRIDAALPVYFQISRPREQRPSRSSISRSDPRDD